MTTEQFRAGFHSPALLRGFTLVELLVVLSIIGLLAAFIFPAFAKAKARALGAHCQNNHRQLAVAFQLYADDHRDQLPYNFGAADTRRWVASKQYLNWVNNVMSWELDPDNTNRYLVTSGGLGPYCTVAVFRCPSDNTLSGIQRNAGWTERTRSVSLNAMLGYAGEFVRGGVNTNNPGYRQYFKLTDVPAPARIFTFLDEHPDSINDGYFLNRLAQPEWVDLPAAYHNGAASLAFADGHVELHRWLMPATRIPARPDAAPLPLPIAADERADFDWLAARMTTESSWVPVR